MSPADAERQKLGREEDVVVLHHLHGLLGGKETVFDRPHTGADGVLNGVIGTGVDRRITAISEDHLRIDSLFTLRRRGVETRMLLDGDAAPRDEALLRNVSHGHAFLEMIRKGRSAREIAQDFDLSAKRIQQILEFAFLSPGIVQLVIEGRQPGFLTSDWCRTHEIPVS